MPQVTLVTGGCRSGKSAFALSLCQPYGCRYFIATAQALDEEMKDRIARHRSERGDRFITIEAPLDLAGALQGLPPQAVALVDCLTLWVANVMATGPGSGENYPHFDQLISALQNPPCHVVVVTNEVGMGIVPADAMTRKYRDLVGRLNQRVAAVASAVYLCACGLPLRLK